MLVRLHRYIKSTVVEGPGARACIWMQGCLRKCEGCFASDTWDPKGGYLYDTGELVNDIKSRKNEIEGITIIGGEPFLQIRELIYILNEVKLMGLTSIVFTGYEIEELADNIEMNEALQYIDLLIDGPFRLDEFDLSRPWVGSKNQRFIFLTNRYMKENFFNENKNKFEIKVNTDGIIELNGMGDVNKLLAILGSVGIVKRGQNG